MIYTIPIDNDIDQRVAEFNRKLPADEKIVLMEGSGQYLFITTEKKEKSRNLLMEEQMMKLNYRVK